MRCYVDLFLIRRPMPGTVGIKSVVFFPNENFLMCQVHTEKQFTGE